MSVEKIIELPDIGDFPSVEVIEVLVSEGDVVAEEDSLITLESDKATMEIPSPRAGTVKSIKVGVGDKISQGDPIVVLELSAESGNDAPAAAEKPAAPAAAPVREKQSVAEPTRAHSPVSEEPEFRFR